MPNAQNNPNLDVHRFASVLAGFDTGNGSDEEAVTKGLALRRMAMKAGMRIVDLLELPEVRQAVDDQMSPARKENPALQEAVHHALALQAELTERTRDVRRLAELLQEQEERTEELSRELTVSRSTRAGWTQAGSVPGAPAPSVQLPGVETGTVLLTALLAVALLIAAMVGGHFQEGGNGNGLGNSEGVSAPGIREGSTVRPVPEHGAVHHRVHSGGTSNRTR